MASRQRREQLAVPVPQHPRPPALRRGAEPPETLPAAAKPPSPPSPPPHLPTLPRSTRGKLQAAAKVPASARLTSGRTPAKVPSSGRSGPSRRTTLLLPRRAPRYKAVGWARSPYRPAPPRQPPHRPPVPPRKPPHRLPGPPRGHLAGDGELRVGLFRHIQKLLFLSTIDLPMRCPRRRAHRVHPTTRGLFSW